MLMLKSTVLAIAAAGLASSAFAADHSAIRRQIAKLDPQTRLEQRCNGRAIGRIARERKGMSPEEVVAYAFADTIKSEHAMKAPGAAFRSKGKWYHLSYNCHTTDDNMSIVSFDYRIGAVVPRSEWSKHYLVP
ncbi:DUF930 domain-containing protein [Mesorhizobium sp. RMAD-H1]|uniref:DUF930 domain-containing protein n=1 Tax=Mesorhizobium sp. RMAD-H1 TaxID=2587065 RepID=UPI0016203A89|nr:DUF930 domain-containing protein [Mesorhizobium sp. RMAD-H1]